MSSREEQFEAAFGPSKKRQAWAADRKKQKEEEDKKKKNTTTRQKLNERKQEWEKNEERLFGPRNSGGHGF
jgi:hypothetical protein